MITILIACGSGVATSTLAAEEVKSVCEENGITSFKINKCSMQELHLEQNNADVVLTTSRLKDEIDKPHMSVMGFITGINEDKLRHQLAELLKSLV